MSIRGVRSPAAFKAAVGLMLLALVMFAAAPGWAGDSGQRARAYTGDIITPVTQAATVSTLPPPSARIPEHLSRAWATVVRTASVPQRPESGWADAGSAAFRTPQRYGHHAPGSRSPPQA
ncbi:hypothetical protein ACFXJ8_26795 [Nonomuraea sp. NPDC059194]|uniref:hypothetical protein n=1 Tax=Nonomuraea sp. NPDC059194 TaxID=3346764 RepID=UPI0036868F4D